MFSLESWLHELSIRIWHPYITQYRHAVYLWKALDLSFSVLTGTQTCYCVLTPGVPATPWNPSSHLSSLSVSLNPGGGGATRYGKVRVCEAGPLDPLPPSVRNSLKKTPPSIRSAVRHVCIFKPLTTINKTFLWLPPKINMKRQQIHTYFVQYWRVVLKIFRFLSIQGLILLPLWFGASFLGPLPFSSSVFCIPLLFMKLWKRYPCQPHIPVAFNTWVPPPREYQ